jgi:D-glutamate N-acetyltransferase
VSSAPQTGPGSASRPRRLLVLAEGHSDDPHYGKTGLGVIRYRPETVVAILDSRRAGDTLDGFPIVGSVDDALCFGATTALVGVATAGGRFPPAWRELLKSCISKGLDVENGLHEFISDDPELAALAARHRVALRDLRKPPAGLSVPTGENLTHPARVVLTVGSDCAIGKMSVALELDAEARRRGIASEFVPTGQTGIAIAGWGLSVDAVVSDFVAGATERLVLEGVARGGELLLVEGQGSLVHPAYSGVTLGLMHGAAPHAYVLCHRAGQRHVNDDERFPLPSLAALAALHERISLLARPAPVAAVALNTRDLDEGAARAALVEAERETGLPSDDVVRFGGGALLEAVLERTS